MPTQIIFMITIKNVFHCKNSKNQGIFVPSPHIFNISTMAKDNDWKSRLQVVYSTNPDYNYVTDEEPEAETLPKQQQKLRVWRDTHGRAGKVATVVRGFVGSDADLEELSKTLKRKTGVGGAAKDGEIIIQGENRDRVLAILIAEGYSQAKKV
jgi:translation initiation factor 1